MRGLLEIDDRICPWSRGRERLLGARRGKNAPEVCKLNIMLCRQIRMKLKAGALEVLDLLAVFDDYLRER